MRFEDFGLIEPILKAIREEGYTDPTPIQVQAVPHVLAGRDLLGCAQTGTGKTAAFAWPILQRLTAAPRPHGTHPIRALVVAPTRELAAQIHESFRTYGRHVHLRHTVIYGGVRQHGQTQALKKGVDVLVATPGRLLDLMGQRYVDLRHVQVLVLDEADRMLDMGFIDDIRRIVAAVPKQRQTLLFSATMPSSIQHLADSILTDPVEVRIAPGRPAAETVEQFVYHVDLADKTVLLKHLLDAHPEMTRALVFTRTKRGADRVVRHLRYSDVPSDALHSDKSQKEREQTLEDFKAGRIRVLVASDIASRGLDVDDISHVVNFDIPEEPEVYVHRIGRTGRAGDQGRAWSFCSLAERASFEAIEKLIGRKVTLVSDHPHAPPTVKPADTTAHKLPRRILGSRRRLSARW